MCFYFKGAPEESHSNDNNSMCLFTKLGETCESHKLGRTGAVRVHLLLLLCTKLS